MAIVVNSIYNLAYEAAILRGGGEKKELDWEGSKTISSEAQIL